MTEAERYWPLYCEENIWHLCGPEVPAGAEVVFISNRQKAVALWFQRAAPNDTGPVIWDYHVVLAVPSPQGSEIVDLDTKLGPRVDAARYLERTFAGTPVLPPQHAPRFRVLAAARYRELLCSDRSHMRRGDGSYPSPPPPWPMIGSGTSNLMRLSDMHDAFEGELLDLAQLKSRLGANHGV